ncbi:sigma-54 dependent transcriptional regulator [Ignavibacteria bacterium]|nr:sigma-54-dependent Fis family transcriptional regulator [Bacteroidota bacterium]MCZ2133662.1 sigma-54 dependent transcriptional regulator [Bacteroidota bacterium]
MASPIKLLVVDDNVDFCATIADIIGDLGWQSHQCYSPEDALSYLEQHFRAVSMMLLDIEFTTSSLSGIDVLAHVGRAYPAIPVIMISGKGTIENAVKATKLGAVNFIEKSLLSHARLKEVLISAIERVQIKSDNQEIYRIIESQGIVGKSKAMMAVADKILRYGKTDLNVLVTGETGTGKKLVAQALHSVSRRGKYPFVTVDIPNIPRELFQSELFGHVKGAFSGALETKKGLFHQANKGTLFMDEIGDLPIELQANLLLPIEERTIRRVGSVEQESVDLRFVSATDRELLEAIKNNKFREQLYHRLRECEIQIPPLRERREDIPFIVERYVHKHNTERGETKVISAAAIEYLQEHTWPGNVRELVSATRVALQTVTDDSVEVADLHRIISTERYDETAVDGARQFAISAERTLRDDIARADRMKIEATLERCKGNVSKASALLGVSRETLHNKIRRYGINTHDFRSK